MTNTQPQTLPSDELAAPDLRILSHDVHKGKRPALGFDKQPIYPLTYMKRTGSHICELNKALLWEPYGYDSSSESSISCSDDDFHNGQLDSTPATTKGKQRSLRWHVEGDRYRRFKVGNSQYRTRGKVSRRDGRLRITVKDTSNTGYLAKAIGSAVERVVPVGGEGKGSVASPSVSKPSSGSTIATHPGPKPKLNIVIMVIGSRGDAQPFIKVGKVLKEEYGHRVRIATHPAFQDFVEKDSGLEFFSVGGDPAELMAFMVKNLGMIPSLQSVKAGDIGRRRADMAEMFEGFWRACISATDDENDIQNIKMMGNKNPFVADAIIANPPSFAHIHCAEALGIPVHLMFTFPYTPTQSFPHPFASIKKSNVDPGYTNFMSYPLVEMMIWQGLGDLVNDFRTRTLGLDPVSTLWAPGATYRLHVPYTYLWSPGLVPKPEDWGPEIDVSGFVFLDLASSFAPSDDLTKFLDESKEPPIYIGFGSIVIDDPDKFTATIFEAVKAVGCRALVSKGWGGLGGKAINPTENIFMLENTPHDWLFPRVRACVIHGGAGTTAIALKCGKPIMIVPFFGDQHFWGSMVSRSNVGPKPIPYKSVDAAKLAEGIKFLLTDKVQNAAREMARGVEREGDGAQNAVKSFHKHLMIDDIRCSILEDRVAVWRVKGSNIKLSALAADIAVRKGLASWKKLRLLRHCEWNDFEGPGEPVTGLAGSIAGTMGNVIGGVGGVLYRIVKSSQRRNRRTGKKSIKTSVESEEKESNQPQPGRQGNEPTNKVFPTILEPDNLSYSRSSMTNADRNYQNRVVDRYALSRREEEQYEEGGYKRRATCGKNALIPELERNRKEEALLYVGEGVSQSAAALARAPMDLSMAVAQGFHNAPRLYGDNTVRRPPRVTGIRSGIKAARAEFIYGIYDGWTGLVRHPVKGAKENGLQGCVKGMGMGLTGFVLKDIAAIIGPLGYTLKGVVKQMERGRGPVIDVRRARIAQGCQERSRPRMLSGPSRTASGNESRNTGADLEEIEDDTIGRVVQGWEILTKLEEVVGSKERLAGRKGVGLKVVRLGEMILKRSRGEVRRTDIAVGVDEAEKALRRLEKGEGIDEVFGSGVKKRGFLGERLDVDATARKGRQERSLSIQRERDEREGAEIRGRGKTSNNTGGVNEGEDVIQNGEAEGDDCNEEGTHGGS